MKALSRQALLDIVAAASMLDERLNTGLLVDDARTTDEMVHARLETWCQTVARGDWELFRQRLNRDGLNEKSVRSMLSLVKIPEDAPLPAWTETLREMVDIAAVMRVGEAGMHRDGVPPIPFLDTKEPFPFEEILVPFVLLAQNRCTVKESNASDLLSEWAHAALFRGLLRTLTSYASQTLYLEFSIERTKAQSALHRLFAELQTGDVEQTFYQQFVGRMLQDGLVNFFREYSVLARLLATITDLWVEATLEFLQRLAADWSDLQRAFGVHGDVDRVTNVESSLSNPYRGRRRVMVLTFTSGFKLVYKPKDLGIEEAYYRLLNWCNAHGAPLQWKTLRVLNRSSHGWIEFVQHEPCRDQAEVQRYYQRAGMLLCLIYVLESTDCHYENIIAQGEHPVPVDLETLMHHRPRLEEEVEEEPTQRIAWEQITHSVLRTGLLPNWKSIDGGRAAYDDGGLGIPSGRTSELRIPQWRHINTDRMALEYAPVKTPAQTNGPMLGVVGPRLEEYRNDIIAGFQEMYRFLLEQRVALLAYGSPLHDFEDKQVRFLYRSTRVYGTIMQKLLKPRYLRDGVEWSLQLELLGRALLPLEGSESDRREPIRWWPIFEAERQAMLQGDTPFFTTRTSGDALVVAPGQKIESCFEAPSYDTVVARVQALSREDMDRQVSFIDGALYSYVARDVTLEPVVSSNEMVTDSDMRRNVSTQEWVAHAMAIAEQISRRAIRGTGGSATWIAPQYLVQARRYLFGPISYNLYSGMCGVGLFLAAVEKVTGRAGYRELALGSVQSLDLALRHNGRRSARDMGIGGASGLGSVIYALTLMSTWLDAPALLEDARLAANLISVEQNAHDTSLDIVTGAAGTILGLLALYEVSADQPVLDKAMMCGQHLLESRAASSAGLLAWPTIDGRLLTGFSQGAAGIAYALLRLYAVTGDGDLLAAAEEGIAYEDSVFVPQESNWPDLRSDEQASFKMAWCHGAPGIGLGRMGGQVALDGEDIRRDIEIALQTTRAAGVQSVDQLCCGNMGRADVLLVAASRLMRPELAEVACTWVWQMITRADESGAFALHPLQPSSVHSPGFFQGTAGIGYELLRIAHPDTLPSVLLWECS